MKKISQELVLRAQSGSTVAMNELLAWVHENFYGFTCKHTCNQEKAKDILQEASINIFLNLRDRFDAKDGHFSTWVGRIILNLLYTSYKYEKREKQLQCAVLSQLWFKELHSPTAIDALYASEVEWILKNTHLLPRQRPVLEYRLGGYAYHEIAEILGISIGTVKSQLYKARKIIAQQLHALGFAEQSV
jgi:RNA polymerase sigma factor (sigma-70 family)